MSIFSTSNLIELAKLAGIVGVGVFLIFFRKELINKMNEQQQALDTQLSDLKTAVAGVGTRIAKKLDELAANNPDLTSEIADIKTDTDALNALVPDAAPAGGGGTGTGGGPATGDGGPATGDGGGGSPPATGDGGGGQG